MSWRTFFTCFILALALLAVHPAFSADDKSAGSGNGKFFQLTWSPIQAIVGFYQFGADFRITDHLTVGPEYFSINVKGDAVFADTKLTGTGYGLRATYQFGQRPTISSGWLTSLFYAVVPKYAISEKLKNLVFFNQEFTGETSYSVTSLTFGYRWVWGFFSMKLAGGVAYNTLPSKVDLKDQNGTVEVYDFSKTGVQPGAEFTIGFAF